MGEWLSTKIEMMLDTRKLRMEQLNICHNCNLHDSVSSSIRVSWKQTKKDTSILIQLASFQYKKKTCALFDTHVKNGGNAS